VLGAQAAGAQAGAGGQEALEQEVRGGGLGQEGEHAEGACMQLDRHDGAHEGQGGEHGEHGDAEHAGVALAAEREAEELGEGGEEGAGDEADGEQAERGEDVADGEGGGEEHDHLRGGEQGDDGGRAEGHAEDELAGGQGGAGERLEGVVVDLLGHLRAGEDRGEDHEEEHHHGAGDEADDTQGVGGRERRAVEDDGGAELGGDDVVHLLGELGVVPVVPAAGEALEGDALAGEEGVGGLGEAKVAVGVVWVAVAGEEVERLADARIDLVLGEVRRGRVAEDHLAQGGVVAELGDGALELALFVHVAGEDLVLELLLDVARALELEADAQLVLERAVAEREPGAEQDGEQREQQGDGAVAQLATATQGAGDEGQGCGVELARARHS
jgi:hypothetical protein